MENTISNLELFAFVLHIFSVFAMTGIVWIVQIVVYPNFKNVGFDHFCRHHQFHTKRIARIVGPLMLLQFLTALVLFWQRREVWSFASLLFTLTIYAGTFFLAVPAHAKAEQEVNERTLTQIVRTNWPRTILWTLQSLFILYVTCVFLLTGPT